MLGQSGGHRLRLSKLNDQLTCKLCGGYFIDATTIIECLHSFCRSCIVKYLESNKYCPICEVQVHKSRPLLNIRPDHTLQDIVYKLVPGCYQNEMKCRREFYSKHPEVCIQTMSPEARGEPIESHIYSPDESLSLSLEYFNPCTKDVKETSTKALLRRYLRCPAAVTVFHLQKLIRAKYGLTDAHRVDVMYKEEPLCSSYTLMDVMYIYHWRRKVPLHLSYRIFETSPKRLKLSEDNIDYKMSLLDAGINSVELKEEKALKREWKEVQLKISETGVMSITDISDQQYNRNTKLEETIGSFGNIDTSTGNRELNKTFEKDEQSLHNLAKDGNNDRNKQIADDNTASLNSKNTETSTNGTDTKQNLTTEDIKIITRLNPEEKEMKDYPNNNNVDIKAVLQKTIQPQETTQPADEKTNIVNSNNIEEVNQKQAPVNNNNNNTILVESKQEIRKSNSKNDIKIINAGAKIDALSVKLQFQPKSGQLGNTYSKKLLKDKKVLSYSAKKVDTAKAIESTRLTETKNSLDISKSKMNCGATSNSSPIPCSTKVGQQNSTFGITEVPEAVGTAEVSKPTEAIALTHASATTNAEQNEKETREKNAQIPGHDRCSLQEQKVAERKPNSHIEIIMESPKVGSEQENMNTTVSQKSSYVQNSVTANDEIIIPVSTAVSTSTTNQTSSAYPYTVQDLVNTALLKNSLKNLATSTPQKLSVSNQENTVTACTLSESTVFNMQSTMSTSLKNSFSNQGISISKQPPSKMNFEITGVYSVPPCPDAIPISLMKPAIRKNELIAKSSNLNEICAKIGASGSKINDICAKIGENSKEKSKTEARNKSDIPDLLKIGRKNDSPSNTIDNANKQQHSNIPNVPVYSPNNSAVTTGNKNVYSTVKSSTRATSLLSVSPVVTPHALQKVSSSTSKKQSQAVGYKTLRDPPRCWNPTLSKNNYVAVKNQSKEMQNQPQQAALSERSKPIQSKPAKIFKMRNIPRYLGNPASGVKPIYGIGNESKEKEQSTTTTTTSSKNSSLNMMKIDPKTLSPIVSTVNSPIVSPPPYSPSARNYQSVPFSRDICRNTGSPISPKNSPVNMLSTNPFIPSPTPNTNPRLIYSHFPPPFPDASRFPNPLIRSPIGIPPPSAFHSSLPPSINKLYQRSSYIPQTTGFSQVSQPPTVQRIPPSTYSSPKSPKTTSLTAISSSSFNLTKPETHLTMTTSLDHSSLLLPENASREDLSAFNLSKTGGFHKMETSLETVQCSKPNSTSANFGHNKCNLITTTSKTKPEDACSSVSERKEHKESKELEESRELKDSKEAKKVVDTKEMKDVKEIAEQQKRKETVQTSDENSNSHASKEKNPEKKQVNENDDNMKDVKEKKENFQVNGECTKYLANTNTENKEVLTKKGLPERSKEQANAKISQESSEKIDQQADSKNEDTGKDGEQFQGNKFDPQSNKMKT